MQRISFIMTLFLVMSCASDKTSNKLFSIVNPKKSGIDFVNEVEDGSDFNVLNYRNYYNGGGVAIGDLNQDGFADIYFTANMGPNKLYLNQGDWSFIEVSKKAKVEGAQGWSTGVAFADINGDGRLDIYVCNSGEVKGDNKINELYINQGVDKEGVPIFSEQAQKWNLDNQGYSTHVSFFDYDLDGDLDCYILNNSFKKPEKIDILKTNRNVVDIEGGDKLLRNDGAVFTDVTQEAGIFSSNNGFGLGISVSDTNNDGYPDMYISNDFWERDYYYINQKNGTFKEVLNSSLPTCSMSSMGSDIADLNNDGAIDIFTTDMLAADNYRLKAMTVFDPYRLENYKFRQGYHYQIMQNSLQINNGEGRFSEAANLAGVSATDWSWGALIFDMDNDGWKDIFVSNGIYRDIMFQDFATFINDKEAIKKIIMEKKSFDWRDFVTYIPSNPQANFAFINQKKATLPKFENSSISLGLDQPSFSNGSAYGDLDNDGDLDLVVNNVNMPAFVYRNNSNNSFLKVKLKGKTKNPFAIGTKIIAENNGLIQSAQNYTARGFQSSVESGFILGFEKDSILDKLTIIWPDKSQKILTDIALNQTLTVEQDKSLTAVNKQKIKVNALFKEKSPSLKGNKKHQENIYNDFDHEILLHKMLSTDGPLVLKGDLNNDGNDDFLLGGSAGDTDRYFVGNGKGWNSSKKMEIVFEKDKSFETTSGAIVDLNGDGYQDIVLGGGGNEYQKGRDHFSLRVYVNDKKGGLIKTSSLLPKIYGNFSCILAADYDQDGDMDLFIGASYVPGNYGLVPKSFLLQNIGEGQFIDSTPPELSRAGMITSGVWNDLNQDGYPELMLVGEWMSLITFLNEGGQLKANRKTPNSTGWWTKLAAKDLDQDGDLDLIAGNWGENSPFNATPDEPLEMYVKDFDQNGKTEFIINWYPPKEHVAYPFGTKNEITSQVTMLKKTNITYDAFAQKTYEMIFTKEQRSDASFFKAEELRTGIFWNENGNWRFQTLPDEAQLSPVYSIVAEDFNGDQIIDLWLGGNFWSLKPQVGRLNSSKGLTLFGSKDNTFKVVDKKVSGIEIEGEVRGAVYLRQNDVEGIVIGINNSDLKFYEFQK